MSDKKVCEVCGRERGVDCWRDTGPKAYPEAIDEAACYRLGYERKAAILTPEVLRLIEAGHEYAAYFGAPEPRSIVQGIMLMHAVLDAAARPFEKPAEQLPKKGAG